MINSVKNIYRFFNPRFQTLHLDYPVDMKPRWGHGTPAHPELYQIINQHRPTYAQLLDVMIDLAPHFHSIKNQVDEKDTSKPGWNNGFLPGLDILGIYTMLSHFKPQRYIEIGSGNSTKVAFKAKKEQSLSTHILSIDPQPRAEIDQLADEIIRQPFENIRADLPSMLQPNDILFVDNSHRILPNSDAMVFFMEVLPRLNPGVIVHIHDIYLPYDYPQFMCDRFYSEQYGLAAFVLANPQKYITLLPNFFISEDQELSARLAPIWNHPNLKDVERHGGSFWLTIAE